MAVFTGATGGQYEYGMEKFLAEARTLAKFIKQPGIVTVRDFFQENNTAYAVWAYIGDSRLYHFSKGKLVSQTNDHSVPQMMVNAGEISQDQIRDHEDRNRLTRVFDEKNEIKPDILDKPLTLQEGDAFLLCTDGVWEIVFESEIAEELRKANLPRDWLKGIEETLLKRVDPKHDNYSAIAVMIN